MMKKKVISCYFKKRKWMRHLVMLGCKLVEEYAMLLQREVEFLVRLCLTKFECVDNNTFHVISSIHTLLVDDRKDMPTVTHCM